MLARIFRFFAEQRLFANLLTVMILVAGLSAVLTARRDLFPRVELDRVIVQTYYPGASPEDVELNVTNRLERELRAVSGVDKLTSLSFEGVSSITVHFEPDLGRRETDNAIQEVREAVGRTPRLPSSLPAPPVVSRIRASELPIIEVGLSSQTLIYRKLREYARTFEKKILEVDGVSGVEKYGFRAREVKIEIDPQKLEEYQMSPVEILHAVQARNVRGTGGTLESYTAERNVVTLAQFREPEEVGDVIVRSNFYHGVKLKDVAVVRDDFEDETVLARIDGRDNMIVFSIRKKESADIIRTVEAVRELVNAEEPFAGDVEFTYSHDLSRYVRASFSVVLVNGLTGFLLVVVILTIFLNFRTAYWVALGIPVTLLGTIAVLPFFDVHLDVVTLTAMILVLGIIVDDAIIVSETIYAEWQAGRSPVHAAGRGLQIVFLPVLTTVATTILAFLPMFFIPGDIGKFIFVVPLVVTVALLLSLVESLIALPAHVAHGLEGRQGRGSKTSAGADASIEHDWFSPVRGRFETWLRTALEYRAWWPGGFVAALMLAAIYAVVFMPMKLFPSEGAEDFQVYVDMPVGTSLAKTSDAVSAVEDALSALPDTELDSFLSIVGVKGAVSQSYVATIYVNLTPYAKRDRSADEIGTELRRAFEGLRLEHGMDRVTLDIGDSGPSPEKPISLHISGADDVVRRRLTDEVFAKLEAMEGVHDVDRDDHRGKEQIEVALDYEAVARFGLDTATIMRTVRIAYDGEEVTRVQYGEDDTRFRLKLPDRLRRDLRYLRELPVPNNTGMLVPLKHVARFPVRPGPAGYAHVDGERTTKVQARTDETIIAPTVAARDVAASVDLSKFPGMRLRIEGAAKQEQESTGHALRAFLLAILGIYFLLVLLFQSFTQPLIVLAAVPFGLTGVVIIFALHGEPLSFMAMLGTIGLAGVVVNDSLVLVDRINRLRRNFPEMKLNDLVARASADRLRAIVMTTVTTAAGLLPLAYGLGGEDPSNAPMALALGWGLVFATPLVLVLLPCLYLLVADAGHALDRMRALLRFRRRGSEIQGRKSRVLPREI